MVRPESGPTRLLQGKWLFWGSERLEGLKVPWGVMPGRLGGRETLAIPK